MSEEVEVVAIIQAKPGHEGALEAAGKACITPTRAEAGCISYVLTTDPTKAGKLVFIETWQSKAALDAHMQTPHLQAFVAAVEENADGGIDLNVLKKIA
ncbi:putative quinol monooxygenase [Lichenicoccus sp.]|uniref:putative quinol monooxygenase n=1 Tax=Lichenicoccus sp. TaxID=2781899 RepID=UPI003D0A9B5C